MDEGLNLMDRILIEGTLMDDRAQPTQNNLNLVSPMESLWTDGESGTETIEYEVCNRSAANPAYLISNSLF